MENRSSKNLQVSTATSLASVSELTGPPPIRNVLVVLIVMEMSCQRIIAQVLTLSKEPDATAISQLTR